MSVSSDSVDYVRFSNLIKTQKNLLCVVLDSSSCDDEVQIYRKRQPSDLDSSPEKKKGSGAPAKHWCFTLFNYEKSEDKLLTELYPSQASYVVYGREVCETTEKTLTRVYDI